jgi:hypothetical protein
VTVLSYCGTPFVSEAAILKEKIDAAIVVCDLLCLNGSESVAICYYTRSK